MPRKEDYERIFREADKDGSGNITLDELINLLRSNGYRGTDKEIKNMFRSADTSGDGRISMDEYLVAMGQQPDDTHGKAKMMYVFQSFDVDGNGYITEAELGAVFEEMGQHFSKKELDRMMELLDKNKSGTIDYAEFIDYYHGQQSGK